ncbi:Triosephosphate isomerase, partial [Aphis craccivora]
MSTRRIENVRTKRKKIRNEFPSNDSIDLPLSVINTYNEPTDTHTFNTEKLFINSSKQFSVQGFIASCAIDYKIPHNKVNGLLKGLKMHDCFNNLPIDCHTILNTPNNKSKENRIVSPGVYHHFGLEKGIKLYAPSNEQVIQIAKGVDGLPISKSSSSQFWPILASILVKHPLKRSVFIVDLYWEIEKPKDSNEYLIDFVNEAKRLETEVNITLFCCDVPAKAFVLKVKDHTEGEYVCNRVCFPYSQIKSTERNHHAYLNTEVEEYQISNQTSILIELQSFN